ncbi:MAG TPA: antitoxin VbhA family protein, partial [Burkholderiaceae bacterium]|nr:antitoxin VbhA family protein [Burkholderiaceae bacterium]
MTALKRQFEDAYWTRETARRAGEVRNAVASVRIEGQHVEQSTVELMEACAAGTISDDEMM